MVVATGFRIPEETYAFIAQLGERQTEDLKVVGSSPTEGNFIGPVAQWIRRLTSDQKIVGSSPIGGF